MAEWNGGMAIILRINSLLPSLLLAATIALPCIAQYNEVGTGSSSPEIRELAPKKQSKEAIAHADPAYVAEWEKRRWIYNSYRGNPTGTVSLILSIADLFILVFGILCLINLGIGFRDYSRENSISSNKKTATVITALACFALSIPLSSLTEENGFFLPGVFVYTGFLVSVLVLFLASGDSIARLKLGLALRYALFTWIGIIAFSLTPFFEKHFESYQNAFKLIWSNPNKALGYVELGDANSRAEQYGLAFAAYAKAMEVAPTNALAYLQRGQLYQHKNDPRALADFEKALELSPTGEFPRYLNSDGFIPGYRQGLVPEDYTTAHASNAAAKLLREGKYSEVLEFCKSAIAKDSKLKKKLSFYSASAQCALGAFKDAIKDYQASADVPENTLEYHRGLGLSYEGVGEHSSAIKTIEYFSEEPYSVALLAKFYKSTGKEELAFETEVKQVSASLNKVSESDAINIFTPRDLTRIPVANCWEAAANYDCMGMKEESLKIYSKLIQACPKNTELLIHRGDIYAALNQAKEALADFAQAISLGSSNDYAYAMRAKLLCELKNYKAALSDLDIAIKRNNKNPSWYYLRASALNALNDSKAAFSAVNEAIRLNDRRGSYFELRSKIQSKIGKQKESTADLKRAQELDPSKFYKSGQELSSTGAHGTAISELSKAIAMDPSNIEFRLARVSEMLAIKHFDDPLVDDGIAIVKLDSNNELGYAALGAGLIKKGIRPAAKMILQHALAINPNDERSLQYLGELNIELANYQEALSCYTKWISLDPKNELAYYQRGLANSRLQRHDGCIKDYTKAIELAEQLTPVAKLQESIKTSKTDSARLKEIASYYCARGMHYVQTNQDEKGLADYDHSLLLDPDSVTCLNNRGSFYRNRGKHELAIADLTRAIKLDPNYNLAYFNRKQSYRALGKNELADADERMESRCTRVEQHPF